MQSLAKVSPIQLDALFYVTIKRDTFLLLPFFYPFYLLRAFKGQEGEKG
jgi:hypothetical protein